MLADFIIKECADICYNRETEHTDLCAAEILEHFGIKE
jgi:hypothetical protein